MPEPIVVVLSLISISVIFCVIAYVDAQNLDVYPKIKDDWGILDVREKNVFELPEFDTKKTRRLNR